MTFVSDFGHLHKNWASVTSFTLLKDTFQTFFPIDIKMDKLKEFFAPDFAFNPYYNSVPKFFITSFTTKYSKNNLSYIF